MGEKIKPAAPRALVLPAGAADARRRFDEARARLLSGLGDESRRGYAGDWSRWTAHCAGAGVEPLAATAVDVARYVEGLRGVGYARASRARALAVLRAVYAAAVMAGLRLDNPAVGVHAGRADRPPRTPWLEAGELRRLLAPQGDTWVARRDRVALLLMAGLALRRSSLVAVRGSHFRRVESGALVLTVEKIKGGGYGGGSGEIEMPQWLVREVAPWLAEAGEGPLFPAHPGGMPLALCTVNTVVARAADAVGLPRERVTPHALRRSCATLHEDRGVDVREIQRLLIHSSVRTTEVYLKRRRRARPGEVLADLVEGGDDGEGETAEGETG